MSRNQNIFSLKTKVNGSSPFQTLYLLNNQLLRSFEGFLAKIPNHDAEALELENLCFSVLSQWTHACEIEASKAQSLQQKLQSLPNNLFQHDSYHELELTQEISSLKLKISYIQGEFQEIFNENKELHQVLNTINKIVKKHCISVIKIVKNQCVRFEIQSKVEKCLKKIQDLIQGIFSSETFGYSESSENSEFLSKNPSAEKVYFDLHNSLNTNLSVSSLSGFLESTYKQNKTTAEEAYHIKANQEDIYSTNSEFQLNVFDSFETIKDTEFIKESTVSTIFPPIDMDYFEEIAKVNYRYGPSLSED